MKKFTLLPLILILSVTFSYGQITEGKSYMSAGTYNSLAMILPEGSAEIAPKEWDKFLKKYGKTKRDRKTDEYFTDDAEIKEMSDNTIDIYTKFSGSKITVWFDLGGTYLSSTEHPQPYAFAEKILNDFELHLKILLVEEEIQAEEEALEELQEAQEKLVKDKEDLEEDIVEWKAKIAQAEADIKQNILDQAAKNTEIEKQKTVIEKVKARLAALKVP